MALRQHLLSPPTRAAAAGVCVAAMVMGAAGCREGSPLVLTQQVEARRLAASLRVQFTKAAEASNRAVMADTDEASRAAAGEAEKAVQAVQRDTESLERLLHALTYRDEIRALDAFKTRFTEYRRLDADILPLAVENTNIKAQRLSFGPARAASTAFRHALETAARSSTSGNRLRVDALVATAIAAVLDVQVTEARHIAESDDAAMSRMEAEMAASHAAARKALDALRGALPAAAAPHLTAAAAALDRFSATNAEVVALSRRNSNVRSLALSLGRKRVVTAECDDLLRALEESISRHDFTATR